MTTEQSVAAHYGRGDVLNRLLSIVQGAGDDPESFSPEALRGADQLHIGGPPATSRVAERAGISAGMHVLDIGCGLGGVARHLAAHFGTRVTGVDLTPQFVIAAEELTRRTGQSDSIAFTQASAVDLPFETSAFDAAVLIHVGMNIADKEKMFSEAARVLHSGAALAVYDIMLTGADQLTYPLPWAAEAETSFLWAPTAYTEAARTAGFDIDTKINTVTDGVAFLQRALSGGAPVGLEAPSMQNLLAAFRTGTLAPIEIYARLR